MAAIVVGVTEADAPTATMGVDMAAAVLLAIAAAPGEDVQEDAIAAVILSPPGLRGNIKRLHVVIVPHTAILLQTKLQQHGVLEVLQRRTVKLAPKPQQLLAHIEQL